MSDKKRTVNTTTSSTEVTLIDGNIGSYDRVEWVNGGSSGSTPLNATNLNRMDEAIAKLYGPTGLVHTIVDTINAEIEKRQESIAEEKARAEEAETELNDQLNGVDGLNGRVNKLETTVGDNNNGLVKDVNDLKDVVGNETSGLVQKVDSLYSSVNGDDNNQGLLSDVKDLQTIVGDNNTGLQKEVNDLKNSIDNSETGLNSRVEDLESKLNGDDSTSGLVKDVNDLKETIYKETDGLEDKVDTLTKDVEELKKTSGGSDVNLDDYIKNDDQLILNCGTSINNIFTK